MDELLFKNFIQSYGENLKKYSKKQI